MQDSEKRRFQTAITYANGYRELGMYSYALKELNALSSEQAQSQTALQMRLAILMDANRWKNALTVARKLHSIAPENADSHVNLAFVVRRTKSLESAQSILLEAAQKFPTVAIIPYNLACYACQNGDFESAKAYLSKAFSLDKTCLDMAKNDEDLVNLKPWIAQHPAD